VAWGSKPISSQDRSRSNQGAGNGPARHKWDKRIHNKQGAGVAWQAGKAPTESRSSQQGRQQKLPASPYTALSCFVQDGG
jgi:hypothetical protein